MNNKELRELEEKVDRGLKEAYRKMVEFKKYSKVTNVCKQL